ncbi:RluA family pseudouridine synthase [Patescibacteria group bacterium]|nr:RluA family pseudouridine synthase [Patescibacteria group bacterium]MBU1035022.1 RluA family pseudouridine synthase [Patescibacteria group bacterium]MBU1629538.1 RluA family pseudouridine synthase [Patescibacteria group bacterium]
MQHEWTVDNGSNGERLDIFLAAHLSGKTRSAVAKLLKNGAGKVNDKTASVHRFLKTGDSIIFDDGVGTKKSTSRQKAEIKEASVFNIDILEETDDWLVLDKPSGLLVHPDSTHLSNTLVDFLVDHYPPLQKIGENPERPGIMHRLDKEVSGLMVIAKTQAAYDDLKHQFAEHSVDKTYLALVHGEMEKDFGEIKFRIARSKTKARMAARPEHEDEGKAAWTHYETVTRFPGATLLKLKIFSGRTHQIRAHLLALGHPVIGDALYSLRQTDRKLKPARLLLQAIEMSFTDPASGERKTFSIPPDPAFAETEKLLSGSNAHTTSS